MISEIILKWCRTPSSVLLTDTPPYEVGDVQPSADVRQHSRRMVAAHAQGLDVHLWIVPREERSPHTRRRTGTTKRTRQAPRASTVRWLFAPTQACHTRRALGPLFRLGLPPPVCRGGLSGVSLDPSPLGVCSSRPGGCCTGSSASFRDSCRAPRRTCSPASVPRSLDICQTLGQGGSF